MTHPRPSNLKWFAIFSDQPERAVEVDEPGDILARFNIAGQLGHIANRRIKGMWMIRHAGDSDDILRSTARCRSRSTRASMRPGATEAGDSSSAGESAR
jgi:hypothetical protein